MKVLKINFVDFWDHFEKKNNFFYNLLSNYYIIEISNNPNFLFYSSYGLNHLQYDCYKIFYSGENEYLDYNSFDFSFSFQYNFDKRNYRLPNWVFYDDPVKLCTYKDVDTIISSKINFCNFIVSNPHSKKRINFFKKLNEYKKVDSAGMVLNNIGGPILNKRQFLNSYKFTIAFENSSALGYSTEKIIEPMLENSIPIYWGDPRISNDFNTKSFINYFDYANEDNLIDDIIDIDNNLNKYIKILNEPWFNNNQLPAYLEESNLIKRFDFIFNNAWNHKPVSKTYKKSIYFINRVIKKVDNKLNFYFDYKERFR